MTNELHHALRTHFGYGQFLPGQEQVITHLMAGKSAAAVFPTGGGKSICYQLPALLLPGVTLVVSPLIALMKDQIDALSRRGVSAARLDSTLTAEEYGAAMQQVRAGSLRLLYVAPERFQNERFRQTLEQIRVSLFAVDEAHCISEWGHNFRPDYLKLVEFARQSRAERMLALTATATPPVLDDICRAFNIDAQCAIRNSSYRPNLTLLTSPVTAHEHEATLIERLRKRPIGPTIVYVTLQKTAEELAAAVSAAGFPARAYHAGLPDEVRAGTQDWFMQSKDRIVVATIAFGMGIDKADIRYVYHFNPPKSLENYSQEIGRAGRDGLPAVCELLFCADDLGQLENFVYGDTPSRQAVQVLIKSLLGQGSEFDVSFYELSGSCDMRPLVVRTLVTYLELEGFLAGGTPFYSTYRFQPLRSSKGILAEFEGERRQFLEQLLKRAKKAKIWFNIDLNETVEALGTTRERIVRALDYLGEKGWLKVEVSGMRHRYQVVRRPPDLAALADTLYNRCLDRERQEIARLQQIVELTQQPGCQVVALARHFGETLSRPCGHCTRCLGQSTSAASTERIQPAIDESILATALMVRREHPQVLADSQVMARWLCGITSPALTKSKLSSHDLFGVFSDQPFSFVRERLEKEER